MNKTPGEHVQGLMRETRTDVTTDVNSTARYFGSERPIEETAASDGAMNPQSAGQSAAALAAMGRALEENALVAGEAAGHSPADRTPAAGLAADSIKAAVFEHEMSTRAALGLFLSIALIVAWQFARLPLGSSGTGLAGLALVASGYLAYRLWLTSQSVTIDAQGFELRMGKRVTRIPFDAIRQVHFDRMSHDLLVETGETTYRVARTLQGHRVIRKRLLEAAPAGQGDETTLLVVKPRLLPRAAGTLALCAMAVCVSAVMWVNTALGIVNLVGLVLPTYVLFDRCIRRGYRLDREGIEVRGIWSPRFHARGELISAQIRKGTLSSTLRLQFADESLELDEYLLGQSLVEISEFIERNWSARVRPAERHSGVRPGVTTELT